MGSYVDENGVAYIRPEVRRPTDAETRMGLIRCVQFSFRARSHSRSMSHTRGARPLSVVCTDPPLTTNQTAALALVFCGLWFSANWSMNAALGYTSVSSTTILSSMSGAFVCEVFRREE